MRVRHLVIPMEQAQAGMVLGQPLEVVFRRMLGLTLPAGHVLTCLAAPKPVSRTCPAPLANERLGLDWGDDVRILSGRIEARSSQANAFFTTSPRP